MIAVAPDLPRKLRATREGLDLTMPLYSDPDLATALAFGVGYEQTNERYHRTLESYSGREHHLLPVPSVFLLDGNRKVLFGFAHPDYKVRIPPDLLLEAARSFGGDAE